MTDSITTTNSEHEIRADLARVRTGVTATTGDAWRAVCTCGWKGEEHTHPSSAQFEGERHIGPRQTVSEVPGQPGRVITGRPEHVEIHNPTNDNPFALIPGAYGYDDEEF